jgi:hypothetical protein
VVVGESIPNRLLLGLVVAAAVDIDGRELCDT